MKYFVQSCAARKQKCWNLNLVIWAPESVVFFFLFNLFVCFWLCWIFVATCQLSLVAASGATLHLWRTVFSLR